MSDYTELKRIAEAARYGSMGVIDPIGDLQKAANPYAILMMIEDIDRLKSSNEKLEARRQSLWNACSEWAEKTDWARPFEAKELGKHICDVIKDRFDALKAENEALRKDAERFRYLMFSHVDWVGGADEHHVRLSFGPYPHGKLRDSLDAAMKKEFGQ